MNYQIDYKPVDHSYSVNGQEKPSVNQILKAEGLLPDFNFYQAEYKRQLGTYVHTAIKLYFENRLDEDSLSGEVKGYFEGFKKFHTDNPINPFLVEKPLYSEKWGFCGTPDCWDNILYDWKCSASIYDFYYLTMAGYEILVEEYQDKMVKEVWLVQLSSNSYKIHKIKPDKQNFLAALKMYQYKQKRGLL